MVNHLQDSDKAAAVMAKLEDKAKAQIAAQPAPASGPAIELKTSQLNGVDVHYLVTGLVTPSWAIDHGNPDCHALQPRRKWYPQRNKSKAPPHRWRITRIMRISSNALAVRIPA